jgi:hypothetical protein
MLNMDTTLDEEKCQVNLEEKKNSKNEEKEKKGRFMHVFQIRRANKTNNRKQKKVMTKKNKEKNNIL